MSQMEQAIRNEIAWHEAEIAIGVFALPYEHRARLAALTAALPVAPSPPSTISQAQA